jgi:hypothetical protein
LKQLAVVILLLTIVYIRTDFFFVGAISAPLLEEEVAPLNGEIERALLQKYHYLGKGRQMVAFQSVDGKWVIKFFKQAYFNTPFWAHLFPKEIEKREIRRQFYQNSYRIASEVLKKETGIVYLHQSPSLEPLPHLALTDKGGRSHWIDLQKIPFVLQRKADPFYAGLRSLSQGELTRAIEQFLSLIASRIDHKIRDEDRNIEDNFGILDGNVVQIDVGKFYLEKNPWNPESLKREWWSSTHRFKKWLEANAPDQIPAFETRVKTQLDKYQ